MLLWVNSQDNSDLIRYENSILPLTIKRSELGFSERKIYFVIIKSSDPQSNTPFHTAKFIITNFFFFIKLHRNPLKMVYHLKIFNEIYHP